MSAANPYGDSLFHSDSASVLINAKKDVEKEMEALKVLKEQYSYNVSNTTKVGDEGELEDAENAQDSVSEDDSDDDSDRKGNVSCQIYYFTISRTCVTNYFYIFDILQKKTRRKQPWVVNWKR